MECKTCLLTDDVVKIMEDGRCEFCHLHDKLTLEHTDFHPVLTKIKNDGVNKQYDCLIGISGGYDSAMLLHNAVKVFGLRPFVMHFDNGWNTPEAENNMIALTQKLEVTLHRVKLDKEQQHQYDDLCYAVLKAGVPDGDIPNDMVAFDLMYKMALDNNIKYILNGHNFRTEGSTPVKFTYMDAKYLKSIYSKFYSGKLDLRIFTFIMQIYYGLRGIKQVRPFYYIYSNPEDDKRFLQKEYRMLDYGDKHAENVFTHFIGNYLLPKKFGIDKRIVYLSALVRSGFISKTSARWELEKPINFPFEKLKLINEKFYTVPIMSAPVNSRDAFDKYNFKRLKLIIYILVKLQVIPYTFYKKYCL